MNKLGSFNSSNLRLNQNSNKSPETSHLMPSTYAEARYNLIEAEKKVYKTLIEDYK